MSENQNSKLAEKLILFAVFLVFAGIVVAFAFNWSYVEESEGDTASLQFITSSKSEVISATNSTSSANVKVNINTATAEELDALPGIGPSKAQAIIEYRETEGTFTKTEDLLNVNGIGEKTFENLRDYITVK